MSITLDRLRILRAGLIEPWPKANMLVSAELRPCLSLLGHPADTQGGRLPRWRGPIALRAGITSELAPYSLHGPAEVLGALLDWTVAANRDAVKNRTREATKRFGDCRHESEFRAVRVKAGLATGSAGAG
jgi:hypothetical protein